MWTRLQARRHELKQPARSAQSMVEFALVLPVFLFMVMGAIQIAMLCMVWISLQALAQDTVRWMTISSQAPPPTAACAAGTSTWPRPRWADGNDGVNYRNCNLNPLLVSGNFTAWTWNPPCANGADCFASGVRGADDMLTLTATYNWSNVMIMPVGLASYFGWTLPTTVTVTAAAVMQY
jgi:hypothetical protein